MHIQWFPGHMFKASKQLREILPQMAVVIEVLDARIPASSANPMLAQIRGDKPCIKILNKSDLADPEVTKAWQEHLEKEEGVKTLVVQRSDPDKVKKVLTLARKMSPDHDKNLTTLNAVIIGIPNVGKSTIINTLMGRAIAKTGNEPAVTKNQQRIKLGNGIILADTPGMLWPNIENENEGYRLAISGGIKDTAFEFEDVAFYAAEYMMKVYPKELAKRFEMDHVPETEMELMEAIGAKRGCLMSGGRVDLTRVSKIFLNEYRDGTLGRISLETPDMLEQEWVAVRIAQEKKAAAKEASKAERKKRWKKNRKK